MNYKTRFSHIIIALFLVFSPILPVCGAVTMPSLLSDNMVLQQGVPVHIWGKADVGERVTVRILDQSHKAVADKGGNWELWLHPLKSSRPVSMTVSGKNTIVIHNILIGEVWFAAGQSNMEYSVRLSNNSDEEIAHADYPQIRLFDAKRSFSDSAQTDIAGTWVLCSPETVAEMSATAYFFSRGLHRHLKVSVGLIDASWGATRCEAWTPAKDFAADPRLNFWIKKWELFRLDYQKQYQNYLAGLEAWKVRAEKAKTEGEAIPREPIAPEGKTKYEPSVIYNGIVAPVSKFTIRGVVWYQGENNAYEQEAYPYRYLFPTMISAWRREWKQGDFPFIFAQLSTLNKHPYWPVLRESQTETLKLSNTAMVVTYDIGDSTDAHFKNKQTVGHRFELAARSLVYGENIEASGPMFRQMTVEGDSLRIWFDHADGMRSSDGGVLAGFEIAGDNGKRYPAKATIDGETILLYNEKVTNPSVARYAFKDATIGNLINGSGLPAVPFRTDVKNGL